MPTTLVIAVLAAWLLVSALAQLDAPVVRPLKAHDLFSLIPRWSFFAPRPGTSDYHLLYRDHAPDGTPGAWNEIELADRRTLRGVFWNPGKRNRKALSDAVRGLTQLSREFPPGSLQFTLPYLATLNYVSALRRSEPARRTEFMILRTEGFLSDAEPQFVFHSRVHAL